MVAPPPIVGYKTPSSRSARMNRKASAYSAAASAVAWPGAVVWMWMIAAPSSRQRTASAAMVSGVSGTSGLRALVVTPFTATSMMTGISELMSVSPRNEAAVGNDHLAGHEAGGVGGQEQRRPHHLLGLGHALHQVHGGRPVLRLGRHRAHHVGIG